VKDVRSLVKAHGHRPGDLQPIDQPLDFIAAGIAVRVEADRSAAVAATATAVGLLVTAFGDGVPDLSTSQVTADAA
jgi:hypothetical protein